MKKIIVFALVSAFALACKNDCEKAADDMTAKLEECGIDTTTDSSGTEVECTDEEAALETCYAACYTDADCAAIDGSDPTGQAAIDLGTCVMDCTK